MAVTFPREFVEYVLLGPVDDRRQLQDSPFLADVWTTFAASPEDSVELLITPVSECTAGKVASELDEKIFETLKGAKYTEEVDPNIAYVDGCVAAKLGFSQLLKFVVPLTNWWHNEKNQDELQQLKAPGVQVKEVLQGKVDVVLHHALQWIQGDQGQLFSEKLTAFDRYVALAGLILWAGERNRETKSGESDGDIAHELSECKPESVVECLAGVLWGVLNEGSIKMIRQVAQNRQASPAIDRSVPTIKGDAARNLFSIECSKISWAVVDSGIDQSHPAFYDKDGKLRIVEAFDFSRFRSIVALGNYRPAIRKLNLKKLKADALLALPSDDEADEILKELGTKAKNEEPTDWGLVEKMVKVHPDRPPSSDHGTHVAGILGANRDGQQSESDSTEGVNGVCPDIKLYDFRILAPSIKDTEFAVIAVLQYIRHVNERARRIVINGANLSLSIPHEVRNYACGRTPVCVECERLVDSGVVVVAAAGNKGYQKFQTSDGVFSSYASFSITDPGNADGVITVGATHRTDPHTYGVSFFSSRGPTGDGRLKPDIVAPGERINGPVLDQGWGDHDGTSMAAPHVSGAAAMVMARYPELIGQPRRIKQVLCENATDLGRERSFQGHGMLDVLRALQSV